MAGLFLTTAALKIYLLWRESPLSRHIANAQVNERYISPLSHAILLDSLHSNADRIPEPARRRGLQAVEDNRKAMLRIRSQYPFPNDDIIYTWSMIRSLDVAIPAYRDAHAQHPAETLGPDEMIVLATAAYYSMPLIGPGPEDPETIAFLEEYGIRFVPKEEWARAP